MGLKERMLEYIEYLGIDKATFERSVGLSNDAVNKMGDNTRQSTVDKISNIYPNLNPVWLRYGIGEMITRPGATSHNIAIGNHNRGVGMQIGGNNNSITAGNEQLSESEEIMALKEENAALRMQFEKFKSDIEIKDKEIKLLRESLEEKKRTIEILQSLK